MLVNCPVCGQYHKFRDIATEVHELKKENQQLLDSSVEMARVMSQLTTANRKLKVALQDCQADLRCYHDKNRR